MVKCQSSPLGPTYDNCIIRLNTPSSEVTDFYFNSSKNHLFKMLLSQLR